MNKQTWLVVMLVGSLGLTACSKQPEPAKAEPTNEGAAGAANVTPAQTAVPAVPQTAAQTTNQDNQAESNTGTVLSVQDAGRYTYVEVENASGVHWLATGKTNLEKGTLVRWSDATVMNNFASQALGRTFDQVLFAGQVVPAAAYVAPTAPSAAVPAVAPASIAAPAATSGVVKSVTESGGYTYIETEANGQALWLAAPLSAVKVGDEIAWQGANVMTNFHSKTLNKTFDSILFVGGVSVTKPAG